MNDDPRGAPSQAGLAPIVIEKHRIRLDGTQQVSFYACGVTRENREQALADAELFSRIAFSSGALVAQPIQAAGGVPTREELEAAASQLTRDIGRGCDVEGSVRPTALYAVRRVLAMRPATDGEILEATMPALWMSTRPPGFDVEKELDDFAVGCWRACERASGTGGEK